MRLEEVEKVVTFFAESFFEALFDLFQGVIEVSVDESIGPAPDDGEEEAVAALTSEGDAVLGKIESFTKFAISSFELAYEQADIVADLFRVCVPGRIVTGKANERVGMVAHQKDFFYLVALGALEDDVVVSLAGEEGFHSPSKSIYGADAPKVAGGLHLLGNGAADCVAEHWFQVGMESGLWIVVCLLE